MKFRTWQRLATVVGAPVMAATMFAGTAFANSIPDIGLWSRNTKGVLCVQYGLNEYDYQATDFNFDAAKNWVVPDGSYGPSTQQHVKWFQEFINKSGAGLAVDGIVGQQTGTWIQGYAYNAAMDGIGPSWLTLCDTYLPGQF